MSVHQRPWFDLKERQRQHLSLQTISKRSNVRHWVTIDSSLTVSIAGGVRLTEEEKRKKGLPKGHEIGETGRQGPIK